MSYILDACALLAFLNKEIGWGNIAALLRQGETGEILLYMSIEKWRD